MTNIKSLRVVSREAEMNAAIRRAASVLKGSSIPLNRHTVAVQASRYVTQGIVSIQSRIDALSEDEREVLGIKETKATGRGRNTAPIRIGRWNR